MNGFIFWEGGGNLNYLFIYFWLCWVFVAAGRLSLVAASGGYSLVAVHRLLIEEASLGARSTGSWCPGFSSCGAQAKLPCGMWDLPGPGVEPMSPVLAGGFLTTGPLGKLMSRFIKVLALYLEHLVDRTIRCMAHSSFFPLQRLVSASVSTTRKSFQLRRDHFLWFLPWFFFF